MIKTEGNQLHIYDKNQELIHTHTISNEKGKTISNTHHLRDTSQSLNQMEDKIIRHFSDEQLIRQHLENIRKKWPRYARDHFQVLLKSLSIADKETADKTLEFCVLNQILHGNEFEQVLCVLDADKQRKNSLSQGVKLLHNHEQFDLNHVPQTSNIEDYEKLLNP